MKYVLIYTIITGNGVATGQIIFPSYQVSKELGKVYWENGCSAALEQMKKDYSLLGVRFVGSCNFYGRD